MCYNAEFGRSRTNRTGVGRWVPLLWGGAWLTVEIRPSHTCYRAEFVRFRSNGTSVSTEIRLKKLTPCVPLFVITQGHQIRHGLIGYLRKHINVP